MDPIYERVQLPMALMAEAAELAQKEGIPLEAWIVQAIREKVGIPPAPPAQPAVLPIRLVEDPKAGN